MSFSYPQRLRFFGKPIYVIEEDAFVGMHSLITLDLTYCQLKTMPPLNPLKGTLETLNLDQNDLVNVSSDYFHDFFTLKSVTLSYNNFIEVPNTLPLNTTLQYLYMSRNKVQSFEPSLTNVTFTEVLILHMAYNEIRYLSRDMVRCWPKLLILYLNNNLLKSLEDLSGVIRLTLLEVL